MTRAGPEKFTRLSLLYVKARVRIRLNLAMWMRSSCCDRDLACGRDLADEDEIGHCLERLTPNANLTTVLASIKHLPTQRNLGGGK